MNLDIRLLAYANEPLHTNNPASEMAWKSAMREAAAAISDLTKRLAHASEFAVGDVYVVYRGDELWAIKRGGYVQNNDGEWEYEPLPSERGEAFRARTRFSLDDALQRAGLSRDDASERQLPRDPLSDNPADGDENAPGDAVKRGFD